MVVLARKKTRLFPRRIISNIYPRNQKCELEYTPISNPLIGYDLVRQWVDYRRGQTMIGLQVHAVRSGSTHCVKLHGEGPLTFTS